MSRLVATPDFLFLEAATVNNTTSINFQKLYRSQIISFRLAKSDTISKKNMIQSLWARHFKDGIEQKALPELDMWARSC